jgi:hypothetical protein
MNAHARAATAGEIVEIVGPLDDSVVMRIIDTGATAAEVLETFTWLSADDQIGTDLEHGPRGTVMRVYEILQMEGSEPQEPG